MASEGEPITDDSFTPRQLEVIRELIVANRPPPSAGAEIHRPPPAETPGPSSGSGGTSGESFGCMAVRERMHGEAGLRVSFFRQATTPYNFRTRRRPRARARTGRSAGSRINWARARRGKPAR
jgi:hypothetical protein